eukprot:gene29776-38921_t
MGGYQQNQQRPPVVQNDAVDALLSLKKLNYESETAKKRGAHLISAVTAENILRSQFAVPENGQRMQFTMAAPINFVGNHADQMNLATLKPKKAKSLDVSMNENFEASLKWLPDSAPTNKMAHRGVYKCGLCGAAKFKHTCKKSVKSASASTSIDPVNIDKIESYIIIKERTRTVSAYRGPVLPPPEMIDELRMRSKPLVSNTVILHPSVAILCEQGNPNFVSTAYTRVVYTNGFTPSYFRVPRYFDSVDMNKDNATMEKESGTEDQSTQKA